MSPAHASTADAPLVAAIVVTWEGRDLVLACLASLTHVDYARDRFAIIVVDNGSTDGTVEAIHNEYPDVTVCALPANRGYAAAVNEGLTEAARLGADYYWVFNNDVTVHPQALNVLVEVAEQHADIGVVGPVVYDARDRERVQHAGYRINLWTGRMTRLRWNRDIFATEGDDFQAVDSCFGCSNLLRASCVETIGPYDPRFNVYFDETDFNERARRAGYRVVVARAAQVWHDESATMNRYLAWKAYLLPRNLCLFELKHAGLTRLSVFLPYFLFIHVPQFLIRGAAYALRAGGSRPRQTPPPHE